MVGFIFKGVVGFIFIFSYIQVTFACSLVGSYVRPSNYELTKATSTIVLARADRKSIEKNHITFIILNVLKGKPPLNSTISLEGNFNYGGKGKVGIFNEVRPGASAGACNAYDYKSGALFLLFLNKHNGKWHASGPPFSRINEEVSDQNAPWVKAVQQYIKISELDDYAKETQALKAIQLASNGSNIKGIVKDVESHFKTPSSDKSFEALEALYNKSSTPDVRRQVLSSLVKAEHKQTKKLIDELIKSGQWLDYLRPVTQFFVKTKAYDATPLIATEFVKEMGHLIKKKANETDVESNARYSQEDKVRILLYSLVDLAQNKHQRIMHKVLDVATKKQIAQLSKWFAKHPSEKALRILKNTRKSIDPNGMERSEISFSLAAMGDQEILDWAKNEITKKDNDETWMAYYVIARSPLVEADQLASDILNDKSVSTKHISTLIDGFDESMNPNRLSRIKSALENYPDATDVKQAIKRSLTTIKGQGDEAAAKLLNSDLLVELK